jgi:hypothetical protein
MGRAQQDDFINLTKIRMGVHRQQSDLVNVKSMRVNGAVNVDKHRKLKLHLFFK